MQTRPAPASDGQPPEAAALPAFALVSGSETIAQSMVTSLEQQGFLHDQAAAVVIIVDAPPGFALSALAGPTMRSRNVVVTTSNRCPEYWDDLCDRGARIVLAGDHLDYPLTAALAHVAMGARYRVTPDARTPLTSTERQVLRLLAHGWTDQQIAERLAMRNQSVQNAATALYRKLGVADRTAAALYYWGIWPTIVQRAPTMGEESTYEESAE